MIINNIDALVLRRLAQLLCLCTALLGVSHASAAEIDACSLLLAAEISAVLDLPADAGLRRDEGVVPQGAYSSACVWTVRPESAAADDPDAPLGGKSFVILNAMQWPAGSGLARTFLEAFRSAAARGEIASQPVPRDFADEALWWGDGLAFRRGDVSVGISVFVPSRRAARAGHFEEQLAAHILRRLDLHKPARD